MLYFCQFMHPGRCVQKWNISMMLLYLLPRTRARKELPKNMLLHQSAPVASEHNAMHADMYLA